MGNKNSSASQDKRNRIIILTVTLVLSIGFILGAILTSVFAYDNYYNSNYHSVSGSLFTGSNSIYMSTSDVYYSFTPYSSGTYTFTSSTSSSSIDPRVYLYNSNWSQLYYDDDGGNGYNFSLSYYLSSDSTYYLKFSLRSNYSTVTVNVQRS